MNAEPVRILLSEAASAALLEAGECFAIAGKSSHPEQPGRIVLHLLAIPMSQATAACNVALGSHKAIKIREACVSGSRVPARATPAREMEGSPEP